MIQREIFHENDPMIKPLRPRIRNLTIGLNLQRQALLQFERWSDYLESFGPTVFVRDGK